MTSDSTKMDPTRLTPEQAARLLFAAGRVQITGDEIAADLEAGAPQNADGTINLVFYAAWLVREAARDR